MAMGTDFEDSKAKKKRSGMLLERNPQDPEQGSSSESDEPVVIKNSFIRKRKPSRVFTFIATRAESPVGCIAACVVAFVVAVLVIHRILSICMIRRKWVNAPITYMTRQCPSVGYETLSTDSDATICITTLTDHKSRGVLQRAFRWRNFDGILDLTWDNKRSYAERHGYTLFDSSHLIDPSRPPAWTKVKAVQHLLFEQTDFQCDWVVWMDADTVIMNAGVRFEDFIPANTTHDLIVGSDKGGGVNSGVFLFRKSEWSRNFLTQWWNMTSYIHPPGLSKSGDNAAMKALLVNPDSHTIIPPRCTLNSFAQFLTARQSQSIMDRLDHQEWFMSDEFYHKSDFIAHVPGLDNKAEGLKLLLDAAAMHAREQVV